MKKITTTPLSFYRDATDNDNLYMDFDHRDWDRIESLDYEAFRELQYRVMEARQCEGNSAYHAYWKIHDALVERDVSEYPELAPALAWLHADDGLSISEGYHADGYCECEDVPMHARNVGSAIRYLRVIDDDGGDGMTDEVVGTLERCEHALGKGTADTAQLVDAIVTLYEVLSRAYVSKYKFTFEYKTKHSYLLSDFIDSIRGGCDDVSYYLYDRPCNYFLKHE